MKVKICAITRREDAELAVSLGADLLGFIFVAGTPRALEPAQVSWIRELRGAQTVGVFRNAPVQQIVRLRAELALDWVQLHGEEPDDYLDVLGPQVLRRVGVSDGVDWARLASLSRRCLPLIDPGAGDGVPCDWRLLVDRPPGIRFALAGGLDPDNVARAISLVRPFCVDVSSGVERSPRVKDPELMRRFVRAARSA